MVIFGGWSLLLPPENKIESDLQSIPRIEKTSSKSNWHILEPTESDLSFWNISSTKKTNEENLSIPKTIKIKKKIVLDNIHPMPIVENTFKSFEPAVSNVNFPLIKYLGQVDDREGLRVFLSIDESNVVIKNGEIYGSTWKVVDVDDYEVRLMHMPTQRMISISKT